MTNDYDKYVEAYAAITNNFSDVKLVQLFRYEKDHETIEIPYPKGYDDTPVEKIILNVLAEKPEAMLKTLNNMGIECELVVTLGNNPVQRPILLIHLYNGVQYYKLMKSRLLHEETLSKVVPVFLMRRDRPDVPDSFGIVLDKPQKLWTSEYRWSYYKLDITAQEYDAVLRQKGIAALAKTDGWVFERN